MLNLLLLVFAESVGSDWEGVWNTILAASVVKLCNRVERSKCALSISAVHWVCARCKWLACLTSVRCRACLSAVHNIWCDCKDWKSVLCSTVCRSFAKLLVEILNKLFTDKVCSVVVVAVFWELTLYVKFGNNAVFVLDRSNLCILDCWKWVNSNWESWYTKCHKSFYIGIMKWHHKSFISILVVHIVNDVHCVNVKTCHPWEVLLVSGEYLVIFENFLVKYRSLRSNLDTLTLVLTTVESHTKNLCKVTSCAEELHLLAHLHCWYTAGNSVVIAVHSSHNVVVFVLDRVGINRNLSTEILEALRKMLAPENGDVRLCWWTKVVESLKYTEWCFWYHVLALAGNACKCHCYPNRIAGKKVVVFRCSKVTNKTKLDNKVINKLLCVCFCKNALFKISLDINIHKFCNSADWVCGTILLLDSTKIAEVQPLNSLFCVCSRLWNIVAVAKCKSLKLIHKVKLLWKVLKKMDCLLVKIFLFANLLLVKLLLLNKVIHTVKSNSSVISDDSAAGISIRKTCENACVTCFLHCIGVSTEYTGVVSCSVCELVLNLIWKLVAVSVTSLYCVTIACEWWYASLKRCVCLKTYDNICVLIYYIACIVRKDWKNLVSVNVKNASVLILLDKKLLNLCHFFVCSLCWTGKKWCVAVISGVIHFDEIWYVDFITPNTLVKISPCFHLLSSLKN